ncbi:MAG: hypothetical protein R3D55_11445 [Chloroflexota bacterium]
MTDGPQTVGNIRVVNSAVGSISSPYWADPINQAVEALWEAGIVGGGRSRQ